MSSLPIAQPQDHSRDAIRRLVVAGREKFAADLQHSQSEFDDISWDISSLFDRSVSRSNRRVYFTRRGTTDQPLPSVYADVVKSWIILERRSAKYMACRVDGARLLWEAILRRRTGDATEFRWETLHEEDLSQAEILMRSEWSVSTTFKHVVGTLVFSRFLAARGVCRSLYYVPQTPRVEDLNRNTIEGQEACRDRLPTDAALRGLADVYREYATEPRDRLRTAAVAILVVAGFRIGELLTMPLDCEAEEERNGKPRYGLRYYKEKTRGGEKLFAVRWLTPTGAELARQAIQEIRSITTEARDRARILEESPHRVPLPGVHWAARMPPDEVVRALGMKSRDCVQNIPPNRLPRHQDERGFFYRAYEVEAYLRSLRVTRLWTVDRRNGTHQMLSESLLIAFRFFFHSERSTYPLLVEPLVIQQISDFLSPRGRVRSVFERFSIREPDGSFCRMTSHQFRHWLNYIADKGGLPTELQTRWMGREDSRDTNAYRHATADERLEWVKDGIKQGELSGPKADIYYELPSTRRDEFLEGEIRAIHVTALGFCLHDFAVTPCPYHLNCVRGCVDYLRTKGNETERQNLVKIQHATEQALASAKEHSVNGAQVAEPWIRHCQETLEGVKRALAIDDDLTPTTGTTVRPFPEGQSRFLKSQP
jgi:hypothetical protein